jgi:predicted nucleotidyltransferase
MVSMTNILDRRGEILQIAARHGARNVRIFGSVASGKTTGDSDLDILVRLDDDRSLLDHIALMQDLEDLLGCHVDVVEDRALHRLIRDRVLSEAVQL